MFNKMIKENISLKPYNTFGIDAKARFFISIDSVEKLKTILSLEQFKSAKKLFIGGGSNLLLLNDFDGLVIKIEISGIDKVTENENGVILKAGAGVIWHDFVMYCVDNRFYGVENLSLIPGTVGAAPMQNIGAYGVEIKDVFESLEALNTSTLEVETFNLEKCRFGYRESIFKHEAKDKYVILNVSFNLQKKGNLNLEYGAIKDTLSQMQISNPTLKEVCEAVISIRKSKLPDPAKIGNSGSFFKNPEIPITRFEKLKEKYPNAPSYPVNENLVKVPAGWLIEQAGWKGHREGNVGVHTKQALVLVNYGGGTGSEIKALAEKIQKSVFEKYGIEINPEVNFIG
ncbi:MAG: UDP-N-acetylmuramate dehydrogenase [Bacteroidetes bacterium]|nr:UDP-N-acetylmuramate dehydrogenase [Bacteroidota bacterium]